MSHEEFTKFRLETRSHREPNGCILWDRHVCGGYGMINIAGKMFKTHRVAWEMVNGPVPEGLCVLHKCDNPRCINIDHLWLGTQDDNNKDRAAKGRTRTKDMRGERNNRSKLSWVDVAQIRLVASTGKYKQWQIAELYGVGQNTVSRILNGTRWPHALGSGHNEK